jgi:hypothetical protein
MEWFFTVFLNGLSGSISSVIKIALVVIPVMIFIEVLRAIKILEKIYFVAEPLLKIFKLPKEAAMPILAGLTFGLTYGAGLIIQASKEGQLSKKDLILINVLLALCHALLEDTFLFVALGASAVTLVLIRSTVALLITFIIATYYEQIRMITIKLKEKYNNKLSGEKKFN